MNNKPIGVFDSGVGGLSILRELFKELPDESFVFLGDQKNVPYGGKTKEQIIELLTAALDFFKSKNVKAVVLACNTATVYGIEEMRKKYDFPIIGTVPVIKQLQKYTKTKKTAVFSTPATAKSEYLRDLVERFAPDLDVELVGGSNLEQLVEKGNLDNPEIDEVLNRILPELVKKGVDTIALGCTHYPFLRDKIQKIVGGGVVLLDSGGAVSRRTKEVLRLENMLSDKKDEDHYFTTGEAAMFKDVAEELLGFNIKNVDKVDYD